MTSIKKDSSPLKLLKIAIVFGMNVAFSHYIFPSAVFGHTGPEFNFLTISTFILFPPIVLYFWIRDTKKERFYYAAIWPGFILGCLTLILLMSALISGL